MIKCRENYLDEIVPGRIFSDLSDESDVFVRKLKVYSILSHIDKEYYYRFA